MKETVGTKVKSLRLKGSIKKEVDKKVLETDGVPDTEMLELNESQKKKRGRKAASKSSQETTHKEENSPKLTKGRRGRKPKTEKDLDLTETREGDDTEAAERAGVPLIVPAGAELEATVAKGRSKRRGSSVLFLQPPENEVPT